MYHFSEAIYIYIYAFSAIIGLPYFCVLEYQQSDKNISPSKVKKFIWPTVLSCKKVFVYLTIEWQWWRYDWILHSPEGQRHCRFCQCFSSRFAMQVGALTASMWRRSHRIAQVLEETGAPRWHHQIWLSRKWDKQIYPPYLSSHGTLEVSILYKTWGPRMWPP